jgi:hypothetical protein
VNFALASPLYALRFYLPVDQYGDRSGACYTPAVYPVTRHKLLGDTSAVRTNITITVDQAMCRKQGLDFVLHWVHTLLSVYK